MRYGYMECSIRTMGICNKGEAVIAEVPLRYWLDCIDYEQPRAGTR
jgi:hypothetical protein